MEIAAYAKIAGRGLVAQMAPPILKGALVEILRPVTVQEAAEWVNNNTSLWDTLSLQHQEGLQMMAQKVGSLDWLTADWVIDALKKDCPALASLFLGWKKGHNWLVRQVAIIRGKVES
jgi:hypothetical protein